MPDPPGVAALAEDDPGRAGLPGRLRDAPREPRHVLAAPHEEREVGRLRRMGAERPAKPCLVEDLGVADESVHVRLGEEVGGGSHEEDVRPLVVEGEAHRHPGVLEDVLLEPGEGVGESRTGKAEVIAETARLLHDLVRVVLADPDAVHHLARGHRELRGVDPDRGSRPRSAGTASTGESRRTSLRASPG